MDIDTDQMGVYAPQSCGCVCIVHWPGSIKRNMFASVVIVVPDGPTWEGGVHCMQKWNTVLLQAHNMLLLLNIDKIR